MYCLCNNACGFVITMVSMETKSAKIEISYTPNKSLEMTIVLYNALWPCMMQCTIYIYHPDRLGDRLATAVGGYNVSPAVNNFTLALSTYYL